MEPDHKRHVTFRDVVHGWVVYTTDVSTTMTFARDVLGLDVEPDAQPYVTVVYRYPELGEVITQCMGYDWPTVRKALDGHDLLVTQISEDPGWRFEPTHDVSQRMW